MRSCESAGCVLGYGHGGPHDPRPEPAGEWERVQREELQNGDEVRKTVTGRWLVGADHEGFLCIGSDPPPVMERKVKRPSPKAMRAAEKVVAQMAADRAWGHGRTALTLADLARIIEEECGA